MHPHNLSVVHLHNKGLTIPVLTIITYTMAKNDSIAIVKTEPRASFGKSIRST